MTIPTTGRKVYFRPDPVNNPNMFLDATVCAVLEHGTVVNLACHSELGEPFARTFVPFVQADEAAPAMPYAHWMPYQVATAAKAAEEEPTPQVDLFAAAIVAPIEAQSKAVTQ